jgi:dCMP deaminase
MNLARREAARASYKYQHGAVIIKGGKVLSKGFNRNKTSPTWGSGHKDKIHAESDAIRRAITRGVDISGATLIVVRFDDGPSKPCDKCMEFIRYWGIKTVIHT